MDTQLPDDANQVNSNKLKWRTPLFVWSNQPQIRTPLISRCGMCQSGLNPITSGSIPPNRSSSSFIDLGWSWINYLFHPLLLASLERPPQKFWELSSLIPYPSVLTSTMWLPDALRQVMHCAFSGLMDWMAQHFGMSRDQPWYPNCCMPLQCGLVIWIKRAETDARASLIDQTMGVLGRWFR